LDNKVFALMHGANMKKYGISSTWERCVQFGNCSSCFVLNSVRYHFHRCEVLIPPYSLCWTMLQGWWLTKWSAPLCC